MESNEVLDKLPKHLMSLVIDQPYNAYTAQDHAVWRYVMKRNVKYLSRVAHGSYLEGLKDTGVSIDQIPRMYGMNRILKEIGWAAVAVDGFIPPSAFMEFQAYNVLVIAADIRPVDQIEYTPAPDIIHEAAGHAPIIANEEYAEYLKRFGWLGSRAFSNASDYELYEAIRLLSILKANPYSSQAEIEAAEKSLFVMEKTMPSASEMAMIRNLHWWTVEYGLIGDLKKPQIYGAGLLSSIGESFNCLQDNVLKLPYSVNAASYNFDITTQQPQLFVTPDFRHLHSVLDEFSQFMAISRGGKEGLEKAIASSNVATCVLSSGLQVSGIFVDAIFFGNTPAYFRTTGPTTLNYKDQLLHGHDKEYHLNGFGSPLGKLTGSDKPLEDMTEGDLNALGIIAGEPATLHFSSGVVVKGNVKKFLRKKDKLLVVSYTDCTVSYQHQILFEPGWGVFDMAVGEKITSAFSGPADPESYGLSYQTPKVKTIKILHSAEATQLHSLYQSLRDAREGNQIRCAPTSIFSQVTSNYPTEWLLLLELLEWLTLSGSDRQLQSLVRKKLDQLASERKEFSHLIFNGMEVFT